MMSHCHPTGTPVEAFTRHLTIVWQSARVLFWLQARGLEWDWGCEVAATVTDEHLWGAKGSGCVGRNIGRDMINGIGMGSNRKEWGGIGWDETGRAEKRLDGIG